MSVAWFADVVGELRTFLNTGNRHILVWLHRLLEVSVGFTVSFQPDRPGFESPATARGGV